MYRIQKLFKGMFYQDIETVNSLKEAIKIINAQPNKNLFRVVERIK